MEKGENNRKEKKGTLSYGNFLSQLYDEGGRIDVRKKR